MCEAPASLERAAAKAKKAREPQADAPPGSHGVTARGRWRDRGRGWFDAVCYPATFSACLLEVTKMKRFILVIVGAMASYSAVGAGCSSSSTPSTTPPAADSGAPLEDSSTPVGDSSPGTDSSTPGTDSSTPETDSSTPATDSGTDAATDAATDSDTDAAPAPDSGDDAAG